MASKTATPNGNGTLTRSHAADTPHTVPIAPLKRRKPAARKVEDEGLMATLCTLVCNHQIGISINLLSLLVLTHMFFPRARSRTSKFFQMSYYNPETNKYGCGTDDLSFVILWSVIFTGLRVAVMDYLLDPLARLGGIRTKKGLDRFKEQAWLIVYYTVSWSLGMYIMYHSEFWMNLHGIWEGWPFREVDGLFKWYYLVQWGFWVQQILVVNIEEKRKDYAQMLTHHIFTTALLFLSYGYYHMRVGTVILCIMDFVDIILPTAKLLKYMGYATACDIAFGIFVLSWLLTRHVFYMMVCYSIYTYAPLDMAPGCYYASGNFIPASDTTTFTALGGNSIWGNLLKAYNDRTGPICWNTRFRYPFLALLLTLQVFCCIWFGTIAKVVYKVLNGTGADDLRSDDECDPADCDGEAPSKDPTRTFLNAATTCGESGLSAQPPREEEVGVEKLTFSRMGVGAAAGGRRKGAGGSRASGISIPGHGDRKELLGRIGCDKPT